MSSCAPLLLQINYTERTNAANYLGISRLKLKEETFLCNETICIMSLCTLSWFIRSLIGPLCFFPVFGEDEFGNISLDLFYPSDFCDRVEVLDVTIIYSTYGRTRV